MTRTYPDEPAGEFPAPPRTIEDAEGRTIDVERVDEGAIPALMTMYERFEAGDRAQGVPPVGEAALERWLEQVLEPDCLNVVGRHDGAVVGHAMLVPDRGGAYELAIFVAPAHRSAGVGTALVETVLGLGQETGVDRVWLTVERWNDAARALYRTVGFERCDDERFEVEMTLRL